MLALGVLLQLLLDHANHNLIGNQTALVHNLFSSPTQLGLLGNLLPQHVTSSEVTDAVFTRDVGRLSTLTSTGRADEDHSGRLAGGRGREGGGDGGDGVGDGGGGRLLELMNLVLELGRKVSVCT